jgi:hypothetical protein
MATRYNYTGGIVTSGLVLNLDAAKVDSYPGTGTTWKDISGNNNNGTLTNGPTFSGIGKQAAIVFDGGDDYGNLGDVLDLGTNSLTINAWIKLAPSSNNDMYIFSKSRATAQNYRYGFTIYQSKVGTFFQGNTPGSDVGPLGNTILSPGVWYMVTTVLDRSSNITMYVNGVQETLTGGNTISQWNNLDFQSINPARVGSYTASDNTNPVFLFKGSISTVQVYFRTLSATEITQNFNALRGRYGI